MTEKSYINDVLCWTGRSVRYIDQTLLPHEFRIKETASYLDIIEAIKRLEIRGAPLLGIAVGYGMALAAHQFQELALEIFRTALLSMADQLAAARPTAVNPTWVLNRMRSIIASAFSISEIVEGVEQAAIAIHEDDASRCRNIGVHGSAIVPQGANVITHCNTGALATGGEGTAFSIFLAAHRERKKIHVFVDETRPLLQGARLTMWELQQQGIPCTLISDSSAATVMKRFKIDLAITGADRIAMNGDTANKIGTYGLALTAKYHGVPFYIAAPLSSIDSSCMTGDDIPIEERKSEEMTHFNGVHVAPDKTEAYAPAFDVTPADLIAGIVTERGIIAPPFDETLPALLA